MSSKTKIVVLHMKEIIYTTIFIVLGILLLLLLFFMFLPEKKEGSPGAKQYQPGIFIGSCIRRRKYRLQTGTSP